MWKPAAERTPTVNVGISWFLTEVIAEKAVFHNGSDVCCRSDVRQYTHYAYNITHVAYLTTPGRSYGVVAKRLVLRVARVSIHAPHPGRDLECAVESCGYGV